jgi:hypothetical protein
VHIIKKCILGVALLVLLVIAAAAYSGKSGVVQAQDRPLPTRILPGRQGIPIRTPMPIVPNTTLPTQAQGQITLVLDVEPLSQVAWQQFRQAGGSLTQFMAALDAQNAFIDAVVQDILAQAQAVDPQARILFQGRWATVVVVIAGDLAIADALRGQAHILSINITGQLIPVTPGQVRPEPVQPSYPVITPAAR